MKIHRIAVKGQGIVELECFEHPWCPGCVLERADRVLEGTVTQEDLEQSKLARIRPTPEQVEEFDRKWKDKKLVTTTMG